MPSRSVTVTANWNRTNTGSSGGGTRVCTVQFETNGGSVIDSVKIVKNKTVTAPTTPTKDGFEFAGWYTERNSRSHMTLMQM